MKLTIIHQDWTEIKMGETHIEIRQEDSRGDINCVLISPDMASRFCEMVMKCASEKTEPEGK